MRACTKDAPTCASVRAGARVRVCLGAHVSSPNRAARLAGVPIGVGVQRGHRRVEHRVGHHVVYGITPLLAGGAPPQASGARFAGVRCGTADLRGGTADALQRAHV
jgi:hypothetical protein